MAHRLLAKPANGAPCKNAFGHQDSKLADLQVLRPLKKETPLQLFYHRTDYVTNYHVYQNLQLQQSNFANSHTCPRPAWTNKPHDITEGIYELVRELSDLVQVLDGRGWTGWTHFLISYRCLIVKSKTFFPGLYMSIIYPVNSDEACHYFLCWSATCF